MSISETLSVLMDPSLVLYSPSYKPTQLIPLRYVGIVYCLARLPPRFVCRMEISLYRCTTFRCGGDCVENDHIMRARAYIPPVDRVEFLQLENPAFQFSWCYQR